MPSLKNRKVPGMCGRVVDIYFSAASVRKRHAADVVEGTRHTVQAKRLGGRVGSVGNAIGCLLEVRVAAFLGGVLAGAKGVAGLLAV